MANVKNNKKVNTKTNTKNKKKVVSNTKNKKVQKEPVNNNYIWFLFIVFIIGLSFGITLGLIGHITRDNTKSYKSYYNYTLNVSKMKNCTNDIHLLYTFNDGRRLYTKCLNTIEIKDNDKTYNYLEKELNNDENIMNEIFENLKFVNEYDDGSKYYQSNSSHIYANNDIAVIKCHKLNLDTNLFNEDIYIGLDGMEYTSDFCENNNYTLISNYKYDCSFTKTYHIENLLDDYKTDDPLYSYIVVDSFQNNKPKIIVISSKLKKTLKENKTYEFTYYINGNSQILIDENYVDEYMGNNDILITLDIKETKKTGLDQINDSVCKPMEA